MTQPSPAEIKYEMEHVADNRAPELVAALAVNFTLAAIALILRLVSRYVSKSRLLADDLTCIAAMVVVIGQLTVNLIGVNLGAGKHVILLKNSSAFAKIVLVSEIFYVVGTALVKFSFLYLYQRLFGSNHRFRQVLWACGAFVAAYSLVEVIVLIFQCRPVNALWDMHVKGTCVNLALGGVIIGIINVIMDFVTLVLPVRMVWTLRMKKKWKFQLIGIFLLGGFVCVGSIVRVTTLHKLSLVDATWVDVDSAIWAMVENCIGVVSACLPTLRPLFNVVARGHHCSSKDGYCSRCFKPKSGAMSSDHWRSGGSSNDRSVKDSVSIKVPETATWAGHKGVPLGAAGRGIPVHSSFASPPPLKEETSWTGSSDEESLKLPRPDVEILG